MGRRAGQWGGGGWALGEAGLHGTTPPGAQHVSERAAAFHPGPTPARQGTAEASLVDQELKQLLRPQPCHLPAPRAALHSSQPPLLRPDRTLGPPLLREVPGASLPEGPWSTRLPVLPPRLGRADLNHQPPFPAQGLQASRQFSPSRTGGPWTPPALAGVQIPKARVTSTQATRGPHRVVCLADS